MSLLGRPAVKQAFFQAQNGWRKGLVKAGNYLATLKFFQDANHKQVLVICTQGPRGSITDPSQVLTSVFFQLRGVPRANSNRQMAVARRGEVDFLSNEDESPVHFF